MGVADPSERTDQTPEHGGPGSPGTDDDGLNRRRLLLFGGIAAVAILIIGERELPGDDEEEIRLVLQRNIRALEAGEREVYAETFHPESPIAAAREQHAAAVANESGFTATLEVESITVDNRTAEAEVVRTVGGDDPEQVTYELRQHDDEWRIYDRTVGDG